MHQVEYNPVSLTAARRVLITGLPTFMGSNAFGEQFTVDGTRGEKTSAVSVVRPHLPLLYHNEHQHNVTAVTTHSLRRI